jgi:hypothetical protein
MTVFILLYIVHKDQNDLSEKVSDDAHQDAPAERVEKAEEEEPPYVHARAAEKNEDNSPYAHEEPDDEYDEVPVVLDDPVGERHFALDEVEAVDDVLPETPSDGEERAVSCQGPGEGIEHDHEDVHVSQPGEDPPEEHRGLSFKKGADENADITIFCDIRFHVAKQSAHLQGPL